jgi:hypothetical protein
MEILRNFMLRKIHREREYLRRWCFLNQEPEYPPWPKTLEFFFPFLFLETLILCFSLQKNWICARKREMIQMKEYENTGDYEGCRWKYVFGDLEGAWYVFEFTARTLLAPEVELRSDGPSFKGIEEAALTRPCGVLLFVCEEEEAGPMSIHGCAWAQLIQWLLVWAGFSPWFRFLGV